MNLLPKKLAIAVISPLTPRPETASGEVLGTPPLVPRDCINAIWTEVTKTYDYSQLQVAPDGSGATLLGQANVDAVDTVTIRLPVLQVQSSIPMTAELAAGQAQGVLQIVARHLQLEQFLHLRVSYVYHGVAPDGDAPGMLYRLLHKANEELHALEADGGPVLLGANLTVPLGDGHAYSLGISPLFADPRFLYLGMDAQFVGAVALDEIAERARETEEYLTSRLAPYLDRTA